MSADRIAENDRHDEGVLCISLDGHHRLEWGWGWYCVICGAKLRLGVWYPDPEHFDGDWCAR